MLRSNAPTIHADRAVLAFAVVLYLHLKLTSVIIIIIVIIDIDIEYGKLAWQLDR